MLFIRKGIITFDYVFFVELVAFDTDTEEYCDPDLIHSDVTPATPDVIRITQKSQMSPTTTKQTSPLAQFKQKGTSRPVTDMPRSSRSEEYEEISVGQVSYQTKSVLLAAYLSIYLWK